MRVSFFPSWAAGRFLGSCAGSVICKSASLSCHIPPPSSPSPPFRNDPVTSRPVGWGAYADGRCKSKWEGDNFDGEIERRWSIIHRRTDLDTHHRSGGTRRHTTVLRYKHTAYCVRALRILLIPCSGCPCLVSLEMIWPTYPRLLTGGTRRENCVTDFQVDGSRGASGGLHILKDG